MDQYTNYPAQNSGATIQSMVAAAMKKVYVKMTIALIITAFISYFCASSPAFQHFALTNRWFMIVMIVLELGMVFGISAGINKLSSPTATGLFYLFAVVNGLMLAPIFWVYTHTSIAKTFFITAGTFGAMSVFGYTTRQDLSKIGNILFMALIGLIIASLVNIFTHSETLDWIISVAGVLIFVGLTAWDTQQIKNMASMMPASQVGRLATLGALSLYLDFINLFLYLLRFFGNRD
ncbi:MAG: Bax inhibitor-1/YccA family protein [Odoribacter sp.]|nr:Bax inhibitor-1/YccA family protein [Odoribacter sp.]